MKHLAVSASLFLVFLVSCTALEKKSHPKVQFQSGHADVNGVKMYYEIHGDKSGTPLVLLHGGGSSIEVTYSKVLPFFSAARPVIAVDEQGHGRSTDRPGPAVFEESADDVAVLLKSLGIPKADIMGFSNGGTVAIQVALRHPQIVRKLVVVSSFTKRSGAQEGFFDYLNKTDFSQMPAPLKEAFLTINPNPEKLRNMHDKDLARIRGFKDIPDKKMKSIQVPTLFVSGDRDVSKLEHLVELTKVVKDSRLLIIPGGHGDFLGELVTAHGESGMPQFTAGMINTFLEDSAVVK